MFIIIIWLLYYKFKSIMVLSIFILKENLKKKSNFGGFVNDLIRWRKG